MRKRTFLIVGRQGLGKSSIGNSILQSKSFTSKSASGGASASIPNFDVAENDEVVVVDTTGVGDTGADMAGNVKSVIEAAQKAVVRCGPGFDAVILVLKYGVRFTKQEKDAVQMVKSLFGDNVFKGWGILVFSYGDNFKLDTEDDNITFEDWCREQGGDIKDLFVEVNYRCVIFDNRCKDIKIKEEERNNLLRVNLPNQQPYSERDFLAASAGREMLILKEKYESLKKETDDLLSYTDQSREVLLRNNQRLNKEELIRQLEVVRKKTQQHYDRLLDEDRGTNVFRPLLDQVRLRTIGLRSRIDQLKFVSPDRSQKVNDQGKATFILCLFLGFIMNIGKFCFECCLKSPFYFIYDIIERCIHFVYNNNAAPQRERLRDKYSA